MKTRILKVLALALVLYACAYYPVRYWNAEGLAENTFYSIAYYPVRWYTAVDEYSSRFGDSPRFSAYFVGLDDGKLLYLKDKQTMAEFLAPTGEQPIPHTALLTPDAVEQARDKDIEVGARITVFVSEALINHGSSDYITWRVTDLKVNDRD